MHGQYQKMCIRDRFDTARLFVMARMVREGEDPYEGTDNVSCLLYTSTVIGTETKHLIKLFLPAEEKTKIPNMKNITTDTILHWKVLRI